MTTGSDAREGQPTGASDPARHVEAGWMVHGWAGDPIGEVVARSPDALVVRLNSIGADEIRIPTRLVAGLDEGARRVLLSVDTSELDEVDPQVDRVRLTDVDG